jgi:hypothetical protein
MKVSILASACVLSIGLYGITPAMAESFNKEGSNWTNISPATPAHQGMSQTSSASFASSWGSGVTPSESKNAPSYSARLTSSQSCELKPRSGFNQDNNFPTC